MTSHAATRALAAPALAQQRMASASVEVPKRMGPYAERRNRDQGDVGHQPG